MGKNILFICGHYAFPAAANSICVQNLAEEFSKEGHNVYVLSYAPEYSDTIETIKGVKVWKFYGDFYTHLTQKIKSHKGRLWYLLLKTVQLLRYFIIIWFYPISSPSDMLKSYKRAKSIIKQYEIDTVIATYMPYDAIKIAIKLKKDYGEKLRVVSYHLDLLSNPNNESGIIVNAKKRKAKAALTEELKVVDRMLLPNTASFIDDKKVEYVDFPLYIPENSKIADDKMTSLFDKSSINVAIVGSLDNNNRNPYYFCKLLDDLPKVEGKQVILHIWGKLSGIILDNYKNVIYHGMARAEDVPSILSSCDFLLNIGNLITYRMIPSKIFQMFAAKRPIILCISSPDDRSLPYFKKYGHVCTIYQYTHDETKDLNVLYSFIEKNMNISIKVDDGLFEKSTPKFICGKILEG